MCLFALAVRILHTKRLEIFRPNVVGCFTTWRSLSLFILKVKGQGHRIKTRKATRPKESRMIPLSSASCDLDLRPSDPQILSFYTFAPWTTCANWHHHNRFIRFQNSVLTSLVTDELNKQVDNIMQFLKKLVM